SNSLSARYLTLAILNVGFTFMCLGASIRGDAFGKAFIIVFMVLVPFTLLHFLIVFFKEKGGIKLQSLYNLLKYIYYVLITMFLVNTTFIIHPLLAHFIYPESV